MAKSIENLVSFAGGEWSPTLTSRVDQAKYRTACLQLRNMLCLKTGPATRRPGTQFVATAKFQLPILNRAVRLEEFQFSVNTTFILEFGFEYIRFYSNGAQVTLSSAPLWLTGTPYVPGNFVEDPGDSNNIYYCLNAVTSATQPHLDSTNWYKSNILEVPTPYQADFGAGGLAATDVYQLQFCAINDVVYICHPSYPRYKLTRVTDTNWTMEEVVDLVPALLDQNATDITIAADATTGSTILTASAPAWSTAFYYEIGSSVLQDGVIYNCLVPHLSGTFATDLAAGDWQPVSVFQVGHIGSYWELSYLRDSAYVEYTGTAAGGFNAGVSSTITAFGSWEVRTYGVWSADVSIQSSSDGGVTWQTVRLITGRNDRNANIAGIATTARLYRISVSNVAPPVTAGATNPRVVFECVDAFLFGIVRISDFQIETNLASLTNGLTYQIQTVGTVNWTAIGVAANPQIGTIFQYNGVGVTGSGGSVTTPYRARADVITQLPTASAWINGFGYALNDRVSFDGVNYVCINSPLANPGTSPDADPTDWTADGWPTTYWSEGAWSGLRGYPRAITAFGQRVWCGFTNYEPQRIWGTQIGDIENWDLGDQTLATNGIAFDLDAVGDGGILWLQAQEALFVGLASAEWVVSSSDPTGAISPTSVAAHRQSKWGSNVNIAARVVGDALLFVQRQAYSIRQMLFSIVTSKYMSQDLTALSDQILNSGGIQFAYQTQGQKNGFVWVTTTNGELVGMTYELDQEIFGWHRHTTGTTDRFESVAVITGKGTADDEVWVVVGRYVGANYNRYIERLNPINWQGPPADKNQAYHVDAGVTYVNPSSNTFTGLGHLEGRTVRACINAQDYGDFVVAGGAITVSTFDPTGFVGYAHVGLAFTSTVQPMNLDVDVHTGVTKGIVKKVTGIVISLYNTLACKFTDGSGRKGSVRDIVFRDMNNMFVEPALFTGDKWIRDFPGDYGLQIPVILYTDGPLPLTVLSVAIDYGLSGVP